METGAAITTALSGAFKNTPGSNLQLRAQACECPCPCRAHQPPASSRTGCKGILMLGAGFVKPGSLRRWLLAAPGVLQVVSFTYLFLERFGELRGPYLGVQLLASLLECRAAPRSLHHLQPHLSLSTFQIVSFKCITSQSRRSLNCDGFGSPGSSISRSGRFDLLRVINLFPAASASFAARGVTRIEPPHLCSGFDPQPNPGGG